jgi:beta-glucosidase-like glycosyl hydrolase
MVGHLVVPGLTETKKTPASLSWHALHYLRQRAGGSTLIVTDSLAMGAIRTSLGLTQAQAAVRALRDGADMALVQTGSPAGVVRAIADAIRSGNYPKSRAVASVKRVLAAKRISTAPYHPISRQPAQDATNQTPTPRLSAVLDDRLGGSDTAVFAVRTPGASTWDVIARARVVGAAGTRIGYDVPAGRLQPAHSYEWRVRSCNAKGRCSIWTTIRTFTTA